MGNMVFVHENGIENKDKEVIKSYIRYKRELLSYYKNFLIDSHPKSVMILIDALQKAEDIHKKEIIKSGEIKPLMSSDFRHILALTPLHEMNMLSNSFSDIIAFREQTSLCHCQKLRDSFKGVYGRDQKMIKSIETVERNANKGLRLEKVNCHL